MTACALAPDVAQYHNNKGVTLLEIGVHKHKEGNQKAERQYGKNAVEACQNAVELDSKIADYHYNLSKALFFATVSMGYVDDTILGYVDDAISECRTALQLNPESSEYHRVYSYFLSIQGQDDNALNEACKAVELAPDDAEAYYTLGFRLQELNQFDEAVSAYRQAIQLNPDKAIYHYYLGSVLNDLGRYREALKAYEADIAISLTTDPPYQLSVSYSYAAYTLFMLNRYDEALQYAEKGIEIYPDYPDNHYARYVLLTYFNRHEEARQELETAYELGGIPLPEDAKI